VRANDAPITIAGRSCRSSRALPADVQLDGESSRSAGTAPRLHRLGSRMLHGRAGIAVTLFVFDVLAVKGLPVT
jgi:hypothetical protein